MRPWTPNQDEPITTYLSQPAYRDIFYLFKSATTYLSAQDVQDALRDHLDLELIRVRLERLVQESFLVATDEGSVRRYSLFHGI